MDNKDTISVLNDLIETSKDGEKGFRECAEDLKNPQLKTTMNQRAQDCATAAAELQQAVLQLHCLSALLSWIASPGTCK